MGAFSIVVVTWQCAAQLRALVESANRHLPSEVEVIVVDNASSDDPRAETALRPGSRFIALERNEGFGAASNRGVEAATEQGVVVLNPDTVLIDGSLADLVGVALERGALAGPRLLNPDGSPQPSASGPPVGAWPWIGALVPGRLQPPAMRARTEPWRLQRATRVAWLTGACVAAPRQVLRELGPFDPAIELYAEDMDLGLRAAAAGVESWFCPDVCRLVHHGGTSTARRFPDGPQRAAAAAERSVLLRAHGPARERAAWRAARLKLWLRATAKRALRRDAARDWAALRAAREAVPRPLPEAQPGAGRRPG